jgi:hypothetical protein
MIRGQTGRVVWAMVSEGPGGNPGQKCGNSRHGRPARVKTWPELALTLSKGWPCHNVPTVTAGAG